MIIKILGKERVSKSMTIEARGQSNSKALRTHEWWIHDNVEAIHHCLKDTDANGGISSDVDFVIPANQGDLEPHSPESPGNLVSGSYIFIVAKNRKGDEFTVATNSVVYLLNDDGKTIEKLSTHSY